MIPTDDWCPLECSSLRRVKVEPNVHDNRGDLLVEFNEGKVYRYKDVPLAKVEKLVHHSDPGRFFHGHIRTVHEGAREEEKK